MDEYKYAGVLPFAEVGGRPCVLLGREKREDGWDGSLKWSGFGGGPEETDASIEESAAREAYEETMGLIGSRADIAEKIKSSLGVEFVDARDGRRALTYFVRVGYDATLPADFERAYAYASNCSCPVGFLEKVEVGWFPVDDLEDASIVSEMRPQFAEHVAAIVDIVRHLG